MFTYLAPLMEVLMRLNSLGVDISTSSGKFRVKARLIAASLDLPAKAMVANMKQFNGKHACSVCLDEGESLPGNPLHRFYPYEEDSVHRTHQSILHDAKEATKKGESVSYFSASNISMNCKRHSLIRSGTVRWLQCICKYSRQNRLQTILVRFNNRLGSLK